MYLSSSILNNVPEMSYAFYRSNNYSFYSWIKDIHSRKVTTANSAKLAHQYQQHYLPLPYSPNHNIIYQSALIIDEDYKISKITANFRPPTNQHVRYLLMSKFNIQTNRTKTMKIIIMSTPLHLHMATALSLPNPPPKMYKLAELRQNPIVE